MMYINRTAKNPEHVGGYLRFLGSLEGQTAYAKIGTCADPALFPQAFDGVELTQNERSMIDMAEALNRIHPNPTVRNADIAKLATAFVEPTLTAAQAIQGLFTGQLSGVRETLQGAADARNKAMDDAIESAKADGANVDRSDLVFANWSSNEDYGPAQYAEL